ncbi:MAG: hypothetical protein UR25_C0002G0099 [Candidatus Nomurabacteria bacterium GW2011_GWE1_32_28]|uniref:Uncharacterized protein n=1 Tax=Candidatus Nomurabacteria bacterium GW2011_GWF1_31_48 TaxID=1618767 RepID=A0A0F9YGS0_9BACT|nr:MAG: hypothetical protein UR10_C0002G0099 [Candidatus Nomurabacteria bacterium GW2011_GWF2_30_133]KKP29012.1 MAG: hypothetical protein UR18_C0001G0133 [Candidatus Nomurabacteria bacterium GW2011_GWE2_31_40]KKP30578.1 MAG: hypothetical protein UR19_C0002G0099 [Candidatus Nomurabacteria bacterium GW2011_GWF1_31_48]KKP35063.1 MAG: hypothetical protein UR25_C0002G0099 [Candidatus Nomurabacteria bacterium GW2011_GWE1_32_28]HAS80573.1 hypothetical protein [Candidatus Nomurabacteria bacterium]
MTLKKLGLILFLIFSFLPLQKIFAENLNVGFVPGNIWYSKDPFEEKDKIKIYTFIYNSDERELSGTIVFFDKTTLLGKKDFILSPKTAGDVSIDWTVTAGDHTIFGKIENAKFLISEGKYEEVFLAENQTEKSSRTISKKIFSEQINTNLISNISDTISNSASDLKNIVENKTPDFITEPIISSTNILEEFRQNTNITSDLKKEEIKKEIEALDNTKTLVNSKIKTNSKTIIPDSVLKPFKYVELFFFTIFSFIFNNKILFYGILFILIFIILRFIWRKIF